MFLKEHARGLYSCVLHWFIGSIPFILVRGVYGCVFASMVVDLLNISREQGTVSEFRIYTLVYHCNRNNTVYFSIYCVFRSARIFHIDCNRRRCGNIDARRGHDIYLRQHEGSVWDHPTDRIHSVLLLRING